MEQQGGVRNWRECEARKTLSGVNNGRFSSIIKMTAPL